VYPRGNETHLTALQNELANKPCRVAAQCMP
jgi:hypothetical protein